MAYKQSSLPLTFWNDIDLLDAYEFTSQLRLDEAYKLLRGAVRDELVTDEAVTYLVYRMAIYALQEAMAVSATKLRYEFKVSWADIGRLQGMAPEQARANVNRLTHMDNAYNYKVLPENTRMMHVSLPIPKNFYELTLSSHSKTTGSNSATIKQMINILAGDGETEQEEPSIPKRDVTFYTNEGSQLDTKQTVDESLEKIENNIDDSDKAQREILRKIIEDKSAKTKHEQVSETTRGENLGKYLRHIQMSISTAAQIAKISTPELKDVISGNRTMTDTYWRRLGRHLHLDTRLEQLGKPTPVWLTHKASYPDIAKVLGTLQPRDRIKTAVRGRVIDDYLFWTALYDIFSFYPEALVTYNNKTEKPFKAYKALTDKARGSRLQFWWQDHMPASLRNNEAISYALIRSLEMIADETSLKKTLPDGSSIRIVIPESVLVLYSVCYKIPVGALLLADRSLNRECLKWNKQARKFGPHSPETNKVMQQLPLYVLNDIATRKRDKDDVSFTGITHDPLDTL